MMVAHRRRGIPTSRRGVPAWPFIPYISPSAVLFLIRPYNIYPTCDLTVFSPTRDSGVMAVCVS
jgi:hypothetical protein